MIEKERLEELIQKRATIWVANKYCYAYSVDLDINYIGIADGKDSLFTLDYSINNKGETVLIDYLEYLFETKEDAEEYAEFGNITRTERLPYMNWDEFNAKEYFEFTSKSGEPFVLEKTLIIDFESEDFTSYELNILNRNDFDHISLFNAECNRENYHQALRLCVKLFKGEEL